jgi:hypothetical protein
VLIMDMNNGRGQASRCHVWREVGSDITGPGSRSATEGCPESSSLSAMSIVDVSPLNLVVIYSHHSCADDGTSGASYCVSTGVLVSLPVQERVGWVECWIRPISAILSQRSDAPISVLVPVRTRCGSVCVRVRCGEAAISSRLLLRLVLALPSAGGNQWLDAGVPIRRPGRLLSTPPARLDLNRRRSHDKRCAW